MANTETSARELQPFSCLICRQRKVKCDRRDPCSNCVRACQDCNFVVPVRGKRKRTKPVQEGLHAKLRRYEEILKAQGVTFDGNGDVDESAQPPPVPVTSSMFDDAATEISHSSLPTTSPAGPALTPESLPFHQQTPSASTPRLTNGKATSKYPTYAVWSDVSTLWGRDNFPKYPKENENFPEDSSDEESDLLLGHGGSHATHMTLASQHPTYDMLLKLLEIYTDRVDPMIKTVHLPTFRRSLLSVAREPETASRALQALIFAFYLITVQSLEEDECQKMLKEKKMTLFRKFRSAASQALRRAKFMQTSDTTTLRAYLLYIISVRSTHTTDTFHILVGIAVRLACKIGLQVDGTSLGLSPFETEMRRRLWWPIMQLDMRTAGIIGIKPSMDLFLGDMKLPLNVPDEDLNPDMNNFPPEARGITTACILLLRCEVFSCISNFHPGKAQAGLQNYDVANISPGSWLVNVSERDAIIEELNNRLETKFLRYCDPTKPLDYLVMIMARSSVCVARIKFGNEAIRRYGERGASVPEAERDAVFAAATKLLDLSRLTRQNTTLVRYLWQSGISIIWNAVLWVLIEVRRRKIGADVDKAWDLVGTVLSDPLPSFQKTKSVVFKVLDNWALEAWDSCVQAREEHGLGHFTPDWIDAIRKSKEPACSSTDKEGGGNTVPTHREESWNSAGRTPFSNGDGFDPYSFSDLLRFELAPAEWTQWETLVAHEEIGGF